MLLHVGSQYFEDVVAALKRCGNAKTVAAALAFVNKVLKAAPTDGLMAARHKTVLRDLRTMLLEACGFYVDGCAQASSMLASQQYTLYKQANKVYKSGLKKNDLFRT